MQDHEKESTVPVEYTPEELKKVVRKMDCCLLPLCFVLYSFSVLDRANLGNAKLVGLKDDIDLSGNHYDWLGNIFYISYIIFQFNTLGWKIFKPHKWVAFVVLYWGIASTLQAAAFNWSGLMACRFFLGWAETMFGPGIPLYLSYFYPRETVGTRFGIILSGSALANAYGGALAYGLGHVHSSISSWRFLFIIEGVPTVLLAIVSWFWIPDSPSTARFLNLREREIAQAYANAQPGDYQNEGLQWDQLGEAFKDYRNWMFALQNFCNNVTFASLPLFLPTVISEIGSFSGVESNGLTAPPYVLCFFLIIAVSFLSDRLRMRGPFAAFFALLAAIGFILLGTTESIGPRYFAAFLVVLSFVTTSLALIWNSNTNPTGSKKAGGLWIMFTIGQCGPMFRKQYLP
ncbi:MFS general substrate transporter [Penicillium chermesinum]|nr:MFS general substrate transporter [Penicillium chermesinum]